MYQHEVDKIFLEITLAIKDVVHPSVINKIKQILDFLVSETDTPEQKLRRMFQNVECNPDPEFVLFRKEIAKRMYMKWVNLGDKRPISFKHWLDKDEENG